MQGLRTFNKMLLLASHINGHIHHQNQRIYLTLLFTLITCGVLAQAAFPSLSPRGKIQQTIGFTTISIAYERPTARGRKIFGKLVPLKTLWRTGAGNCTKITVDAEVLIDKKPIPAGAYSLFTIPDKEEWTIILNRDTSLYGVGGYDKNKDIIRFKAHSISTERFYESFTIDMDITDVGAELNMSWENTRVAFQIHTQTDKHLEKMIDGLLSGEIKDPDLLAMGAEYYSYRTAYLEVGLKLINRALEIQQQGWYYRVKREILTKSQSYEEALETLDLQITYLKTNPENWTEEQVRTVLEEQEKTRQELLDKIEN